MVTLPLLHWASRGGHTAAILTLLQAGADKSIKNIAGKTALDLARDENHLEAIKILSN